jgi:histidine triad (HIT) family protein
MDSCIFCSVIAGKLPSTKLYEDDDVIVIRDIHPQAPVHWLVISKKHVPELLQVPDDLAGKMMAVVNKIIRDQGIEKYRIVINGKGAVLVDHLHIHVLGSIDKFRTL